ncbi:hypothetical protein DAI22_07g163801 [Oryza sativa Japonica Group]|nr:hypothetical protein DAI22_07g163801 [Oryza sativa Japonica Group]
MGLGWSPTFSGSIFRIRQPSAAQLCAGLPVGGAHRRPVAVRQWASFPSCILLARRPPTSRQRAKRAMPFSEELRLQ